MSVATGVAMARSRFENDMKLLGVVRRGRPVLMMTTALQATVMLVLSLPADAQPAPNARPTGGSVVAGAAAISQTATNTAINQSSQRAAVNWQSFNVGSRQSVTFNQPSASAVTLNRVTGPDPSQIAGRIDANGQIILVNQSGITFYKGSQVNANGLIATAAGISTPNFMSGVMTFDRAAKPNARIDNQGTITVKQAGLAALVAPQVANSGVINARLGHIVLAGAKTATLDLYGDGLLSLDVTNQVVQTPRDASGQAATALVTNTGVIQADGGTVQLTARAADGIVANLVEAGGKIRAASVGAQTGVVALNGVGGSIVVEGQLSAPGHCVHGESQRERQGRRRRGRARHDAGPRARRPKCHAGADRGQHGDPAGRQDQRQCDGQGRWRACHGAVDAVHHHGGHNRREGRSIRREWRDRRGVGGGAVADRDGRCIGSAWRDGIDIA